MDKKYKIVSFSSLVPLVLMFKTISDEDAPTLTLNVQVDYRNDKVYFDSIPENCKELDLAALEKQILDTFKPPHFELPEEYNEYFKKAQEVKSGGYATSFNQIDLTGGYKT
jgi:hypothetical protein